HQEDLIPGIGRKAEAKIRRAHTLRKDFEPLAPLETFICYLPQTICMTRGLCLIEKGSLSSDSESTKGWPDQPADSCGRLLLGSRLPFAERCPWVSLFSQSSCRWSPRDGGAGVSSTCLLVAAPIGFGGPCRPVTGQIRDWCVLAGASDGSLSSPHSFPQAIF